MKYHLIHRIYILILPQGISQFLNCELTSFLQYTKRQMNRNQKDKCIDVTDQYSKIFRKYVHNDSDLEKAKNKRSQNAHHPVKLIFKDDTKDTFLVVGDPLPRLKQLSNFLQEAETKMELVSDQLCGKNREENPISQQNFQRYFKRMIEHQKYIISQTQKNHCQQFAENPHFLKMNNFSIIVQNKVDTQCSFTLQGKREELIELKEGKIVRSNLISNFLKMLKFSRKDGDNIQFASLKFLALASKTKGGEGITAENAFRIVRANYQSSYSCLQAPILSKQLSIIPIFSGNHYSLLIIKKTSQNYLQLIYCSSRYTQRKQIMLTIRQYLKIQQERHPTLPKILDKNVQEIQLMVPKQVRSEDSGLYFMLNCECLLTGKTDLEKVENYLNRNKLYLFSRNLALRMRQRVWNLYSRLTDPAEMDKSQFVNAYFAQKKSFEGQSAMKLYYDKIERKEVSKMECLLGQRSLNQKEKYEMELELYYNSRVNNYTE